MRREIYFAGGCFWGVEKFFSLIDGVSETAVGYANGKTENPTYEEVCKKDTGHAEVVKVVYQGDKLPLSFLLDMFYSIIDPTSLNRQGGDIGPQYRTGIYYVNHEDEPVIRASLTGLEGRYQDPIVVEVMPLLSFYSAEDYHQNYLDKNPSGYCHVPLQAFKRAAAARPYAKKSDAQLKAELTDIQYAVTQQDCTEIPFHNEYNAHFEPGIYVDITTGEPLFVSTDKFDAGCGWPAFSRPINQALLKELPDHSLTERHRVEVRSQTGDSHLGHVFQDGPEELGGLRYCINSAALRFVHKNHMEKEGYGAYLTLLSKG